MLTVLRTGSCRVRAEDRGAIVYRSILDSNLPPRARRQVAQARRQAATRNTAAQGRPAVWRAQVRAEESAYVRTLRAQLRAEST